MLEPVSTLKTIAARSDESPGNIPGDAAGDTGGDTAGDTAGDTPDFRTLRRTDPERARALARSAGEAALVTDDRRGAAAARLTLALCDLDAADYAAAAAHLGEVQAILDAEGSEGTKDGVAYGVEETGMLLVQALLHCRRGDYGGALRCALAGLEGAQQLDAASGTAPDTAPNTSFGPPDATGTELDRLEPRRLEVQRVRVQALRVTGEVYGYCNLEKSCDLLREALAAAQVLGDSFEVSETLLLLGRSQRLSGDYREALRYGLEALEHKRAAGDRLGVAFALNALGLAHHDLGDNAQALAYYLEGLALSETLGDRRSTLALLGNLSEVYCSEVYSGEAGPGTDAITPGTKGTDLDDADAEHLTLALEYTHRSLELSEEIGSLDTAGISLRGLGTLYTRKGESDKALAFFERALELQSSLGDSSEQALTLCELAGACAAAGTEAAEHYRASLALARSEHARPSILAQVLASFGAYIQDSQKARQHLGEALQLAQQMGLLNLVCRCSKALYGLDKAEGEFGDALGHLETLYETTRVLESEHAARRTQRLLARFELEKMQQEAALQELRNSELAAANSALNELNDRNLRLLERLREQAAHLQQQAAEDSLTGLHNRRYAERQLKKEFVRARRYGRPLSVALADIDNFKRVNDTFSHAVGDAVLKTLAKILSASLRPTDIAARYGGEEFVLMLPETGAVGGRAVCERLRRAVESYPWRDLHPELRVTLSVGLCSELDPVSVERMLSAADAKLYRAKGSGKNRVV